MHQSDKFWYEQEKEMIEVIRKRISSQSPAIIVIQVAEIGHMNSNQRKKNWKSDTRHHF